VSVAISDVWQGCTPSIFRVTDLVQVDVQGWVGRKCVSYIRRFEGVCPITAIDRKVQRGFVCFPRCIPGLACWLRTKSYLLFPLL